MATILGAALRGLLDGRAREARRRATRVALGSLAEVAGALAQGDPVGAALNLAAATAAGATAAVATPLAVLELAQALPRARATPARGSPRARWVSSDAVAPITAAQLRARAPWDGERLPLP